MSFEEKYRKKREREDNYIKKFNPDVRPVLLIHKKQVYSGLDTPHEEDDSYFKVSDNTERVDDIDNEILEQESFIKRTTVVHGMEKRRNTIGATDDPTAIYKIEGIEFLPEGFIELDPILFKDEYIFDDERNEKLFNEEQNHAKVKRRKQYWERNQNKMRDVTLYIMDEQRDYILDYLEKWYYKHRRRMNDDEIKSIAKELKIDSEKMRKLQDAYLKHKKKTNTRRLSDLMERHKKLNQSDIIKHNDSEKQVTVPQKLDRYFLKNTDRAISPNTEFLIETKEGKRRKDVKTNFRKKSDAGLDRGLNKNSSKRLPAYRTLKPNNNSYAEMAKYQREIKGFSSTKNLDILEEHRESDINYDVDGLTERLRNYRPNNIETSKDVSPIVPKEDYNNDREDIDFKNHMEKQLKHLNVLSAYQNKYIGGSSKMVQLNKKAMLAKNKERMVGIGEPQRCAVVIKNDNNERLIQHKLNPTFIENKYYFHTIEEMIDNSGNKKASIITRDDKGGLVFEKDLPDELTGDYYEGKVKVEEVLEEISEEKGESKEEEEKDDGNKLAEDKTIGEKIKDLIKPGKPVKKRKFTYQLKNNKNEDVLEHHITTVDINPENLLNNSSDPNDSKDDVIEIKESVSEIKKKHTLKPILVHGQYFQQQIDESAYRNGVRKATLTIYDEQGKKLHSEDINPDYLGENYYADLTEDLIDEMGKRKATLSFRNNNDEVINNYSFNPQIYDQIAKDHLLTSIDNVIEEVVDKEGNKRLTLITPEYKGESVLYQEFRPNDNQVRSRTRSRIRPTVVTNEYYDEAVDSIMDDLRRKNSSKEERGRFSSINENLDIHHKEVTDGFVIDHTDDKESEKRNKVYLANENCIEIVNEIDNKDNQILRPTELSEEQYINVARRISNNKAKPQVIRPTIIGAEYYGQIVNDMLDHSKNIEAIDKTKPENDVKDSDDYYIKVFDEINDHRKKLITGHQLSSLYDNNIINRNVNEFKDFEEQHDVNVYITDDFAEEEEQDKANPTSNVRARISTKNPAVMGKRAIEEDHILNYYTTPLDISINNKSVDKQSIEIREELKKDADKDLEPRKAFYQGSNLYNDRYRTGISKPDNEEEEGEEEEVVKVNYEINKTVEPEIDIEIKKEEEEPIDKEEEPIDKEEEPIDKGDEDKQSISRKSRGSKFARFSETGSVKRNSVQEKVEKERNKRDIKLENKVKDILKRRKTEKLDDVDKVLLERLVEELIDNTIEERLKNETEIFKSQIGNENLDYSDIRDKYMDNKVEELILNKEVDQISTSERVLLDHLKYRILDEKVNIVPQEIEPRKDSFKKKLSALEIEEKDKLEEPEINNEIESIKEEKIESIKEEKQAEIRVKEIAIEERMNKSGIKSDIVSQIEDQMKSIHENKNLMSGFEEFCRFKLPHDAKYKDSVMILSLFYHFLDKKKLLNK